MLSMVSMTATSPIKEMIEYLKEDRDFHYEDKPEEELFEECKKRYWLPFEWGIYTTSLARLRLYEGIKLVSAGQNYIDDPENPQSDPDHSFSDFVYCDTDSVKYIGKADWTAYNKLRMEDSIRNGAYATDPAGITHYMGVYEEEHKMDKFRTCGSKKYAYLIGDKLSVTIAGVDKKLGGKELAAHGGIDALKDGFVFRDAGGLCAKYNDFPETEEIVVDGYKLPIISNCYLCASEYTLGTLEIYKRILYMAKIDLDRIGRIMYNELASGELED